MIEPYDEKHEDAPVERNANLAEPFRGFLNALSPSVPTSPNIQIPKEDRK